MEFQGSRNGRVSRARSVGSNITKHAEMRCVEYRRAPGLPGTFQKKL